MKKPDMRDVTEKVLNISTAHIPERTAQALGTGTEFTSTDSAFHACLVADLWDKISYTPWAVYGWIIWAGHDVDEIKGEHPELARLMQFAVEYGYTYLKLDCDAEQLPESLGFPTFEW